MKKIYIAFLALFVFVGCHADDLSKGDYYVPQELDVSYSKGNANASVVITEFTDYECPFCAKFTLEILPQLQKDYIETGKILFVFKDFPIPNHQYAQKASEATYCAGEQNEEAYWQMHVKLFEFQKDFSNEKFVEIASDLNLEINAFNTCMDSGKYKNLVLRNRQEGINLGVTATPSILINDELIVGLQPYDNLSKIIEIQLKK